MLKPCNAPDSADLYLAENHVPGPLLVGPQERVFTELFCGMAPSAFRRPCCILLRMLFEAILY